MDHTEEKRENLIQVDLKQIMEDSFLDYSMSVICPARCRMCATV